MFRIFIILGLCCFGLTHLSAQTVVDAARFIASNSQISPRAAALNVAYHGISDDASSLFYNPAGLALIGVSELSVGIGYNRMNADINYLSQTNNVNKNNVYITHAVLATPLDANSNKASIAIGYFLEKELDFNHNFSGFNTKSSIIDFASKNASSLTNPLQKMKLLEGRQTIYKDSLFQKKSVQEIGSIHNIRAGVGYNVSERFAIGFNLSTKFGSFDYVDTYSEIDTKNVYQKRESAGMNVDGDLDELKINSSFRQDISAFSAGIGFQYKVEDFMRIGASINFPSKYSITETFQKKVTAFFDDGMAPATYSEGPSTNEYEVITPFKYSAGMSVNKYGLTVSFGLEYSDASQLEFSNAHVDVLRENERIREDLTDGLTWGLGAEYEIPESIVVLRASYSTYASIRKNKDLNKPMNIIAFGAGIILEEGLMLNMSTRIIKHEEQRNNYGNNNYLIKKSPLNFAVGISYRY